MTDGTVTSLGFFLITKTRCSQMTTALHLRTLHETRHRGWLAMARSAFETLTLRGGACPSKNRLVPFFDLFRCIDRCWQSVDMDHTLNASIPRHCRACQTGPTDSAGMYPQVPRLASRRRIAYPPGARAGRLLGRADNQRCDGWRPTDWPNG